MTPTQIAIQIAMNAMEDEITKARHRYDTKETTKAQFRSVRNELAKIHNRLGKRFKHDWTPIELA